MKINFMVILFFILFLPSLVMGADWKRDGSWNLGIQGVAGAYKSKGDVVLTFRSSAFPQFAVSETINATGDSDDTSGSHIYLGKFLNNWLSWTLSVTAVGAEDDVVFTASNGTTYQTKVELAHIFISPLTFTFYPLRYLYLKFAPGVAIEAGSIKTEIPNMEKVDFAVVGGGVLYGIGLDYMLLSWFSLNVGFLGVSATTSEQEVVTNPGQPIEFVVKAKERKLNYNAFSVGVNFYF